MKQLGLYQEQGQMRTEACSEYKGGHLHYSTMHKPGSVVLSHNKISQLS